MYIDWGGCGPKTPSGGLRILRGTCPFHCVDICTDGVKALVGQTAGAFALGKALLQMALIMTVFFAATRLQGKKSFIENVLNGGPKITSFSNLDHYRLIFNISTLYK